MPSWKAALCQPKGGSYARCTFPSEPTRKRWGLKGVRTQKASTGHWPDGCSTSTWACAGSAHASAYILYLEFKCWYKNIPKYTHHILDVTSLKHIFSRFNVSAAGLPLHPHLIGSDCLVWVLGNRGGFLQMVPPSQCDMSCVGVCVHTHL